MTDEPKLIIEHPEQKWLREHLDSRNTQPSPLRVLVMKGFPYNSFSPYAARVYMAALRKEKP